MAEDTEFELRTDIMPSEILLLADNWRESPDKNCDSLALSMAAVGLLHPPIVAQNKNGRYIAIDGNRRTYVGQLLEKGYRTKMNGIQVTLGLPSNWRVSLIKKKYEEIGDEEIDTLRLHSTEEHIHFSKMAKITQIWKTAQEFATERGLTFKQVRLNKTLNDELIDYLTIYYKLDKKEIIRWLNSTRNYHKYADEVEIPLHKKEIGSVLASTLSSGVEKKQIKPLIEEIKDQKKRGVHEQQLLKALNEAKRKKGDIIKNFGKETQKISLEKTITLKVAPNIFEMLKEEKDKKKRTWSEFLVPTFVANIDIYFPNK